MGKEFEKFNLLNSQGQELTRLNADVMFYINVPLRELRDEILEVMESFYKLCPKEKMGWYASETMKQFKPATKRSFNLPAAWWKEGAPRKNLRELMIKGGARHDSVATCGIYIRGAERENIIFEKNSNYIRFILPPEFLETDFQRFVDFAVGVCKRIPFVSGHGGYVIECNPYFPNESQGAAYPLAMRYQAADIATMSRGPWAVRGERIKNVGWLTLIGSRLLKQIGGAKSLQARAGKELIISKTAHGVVIRAGEKPILGDANRAENLSAFVNAYRLVEPLHAGIEKLFAPFNLAKGKDAAEATKRWLFRFQKGTRKKH